MISLLTNNLVNYQTSSLLKKQQKQSMTEGGGLEKSAISEEKKPYQVNPSSTRIWEIEISLSPFNSLFLMWNNLLKFVVPFYQTNMQIGLRKMYNILPNNVINT